MKSHLRALLRFALGLCVALAAARCPAAELRVTHSLWEGLPPTAARQIFQRFGDETGTAMRVEVVSDGRYADVSLQTPAASLPDVALVYAESVARLADAGAIVPLDDVLDARTRADFVGDVLQSTTYRGKLWAVPIQADPYALFCNMELFRKAGVALPRTWDEVLSAARRLTRDTNGDGKPDTFGYSQCVFQYPLIMWQYGGDFLIPDGKRAGFDGRPEMVDALLFYVNLRECSPNHVDFERGDIAMKISVVRNIPRYAHLDFRVIPIPARNGRHANSFGESAGPLCLVVFKQEPDKEALARQCARYWLQPKVALWYSTWTGSVPLRKSVLADPAWKRYLENHPHSRAFAAELAHARARTCFPQYPEVKIWLSNACNRARDADMKSRVKLGMLLNEAAEGANAALAAPAGPAPPAAAEN
jgi:multiple sugar transport system substrate-binding protein